MDKINDVVLTCIGHGTLMIEFEEKIIHIDPWTKLADYRELPKADLVLVTHEHQDHLDPKALDLVIENTTTLIYTEQCSRRLEGRYTDALVLKNGDQKNIDGILIEAVPAYNLTTEFHLKGFGNGYILNCGSTRIYIAGDTENIPEMKSLKDIDVAFLPMNLPYTMTPEMVTDAVLAFKPKILYPYHFGETDTNRLTDLLKNSGIEVRIRDMA